MSSVLAEVMSRLDELHRNPNSVTGKATGYTDLDEMTTGTSGRGLDHHRRQTKHGQDESRAEHCRAHRPRAPASGPRVLDGDGRHAARHAPAGLQWAGSTRRSCAPGGLDPADWDRLGTALGKLNEAPILIDETAALNPLELRARAAQVARVRRPGPHRRRLHPAHAGVGFGLENRATEISEISRGPEADGQGALGARSSRSRS